MWILTVKIVRTIVNVGITDYVTMWTGHVIVLLDGVVSCVMKHALVHGGKTARMNMNVLRITPKNMILLMGIALVQKDIEGKSNFFHYSSIF